MLRLRIVMIICGLILGIFLVESDKEKVSREYWEVYFVRNGDYCDLPELGESIKIRFEEIEENGLHGMYQPFKKLITIEKADSNTLSHEAYHATMDILRKYKLYEDEEYGAYMVGSLVECIENIKG